MINKSPQTKIGVMDLENICCGLRGNKEKAGKTIKQEEKTNRWMSKNNGKYFVSQNLLQKVYTTKYMLRMYC